MEGETDNIILIKQLHIIPTGKYNLIITYRKITPSLAYSVYKPLFVTEKKNYTITSTIL